MADHEPMKGGCPEPEPSQELRDALTLLGEHSDNLEFRILIDDVLAGRRSLIEASGTAAFNNVIFASIAEDLARLTDEDKQRLAEQAKPPSPHDEKGSCGLPCASCSGICAALRAHPDR